MKSGIARVLLILFLALVVAAAWYKPLESVAAPQVDAGLQRALLSFATARTLNTIISTIQSAELSFQPLGVGTTVAPGQMLRPVNELIAQFAELMLAASIAFGLMKVMLGIGSSWVISLLTSTLVLIWGWFRWRGQHAPHWIEKALLIFLIVRFALPLVTIGSDAVFETFMQHEYTASQRAIEGNRGELMALVPTLDENNAGKGVMEQMKAWWSKVDIVEWLKKLRQGANRATEHFVKLIVVFLVQTLAIPLLFFWALYGVAKAVICSAPTRSAASHV